MIDEAEFSLFEDDDDDDERAEPTNILFVGVPLASDDLVLAEAQYRGDGDCPVMFVGPVDDENPDDGPLQLENSATFAALMGLPLDTPLTPEDAMDFRDRYTGPSGEWLYNRLAALAAKDG